MSTSPANGKCDPLEDQYPKPMTPTEINRTIAGLCGWDLWVIIKGGYFYRPDAHGYTSCISDAWKVPHEIAKRHEYLHGEDQVLIRQAPIPNYHASLDACHEMEKHLRWCAGNEKDMCHMWRAYGEELVRIGGPHWTWYSTAPQRCEAFLRLHGKWIET